MNPNIIYLHGFASSPNSEKARYFQQRFVELGIAMQVPDMNVPSFEELTLTDMLNHLAGVVRSCPPGPVYMIGSSMGGLTALNFVDRYKNHEAKRVELLFLLAPAIDMAANRRVVMGDEALERWKRTGWIEVHNHAANAPRRIHYRLHEDMERYHTQEARVNIPTMIYHGKQDKTVPIEQSIEFAKARGNVTLRIVESDHSLSNQLEAIWKDMIDFFVL